MLVAPNVGVMGRGVGALTRFPPLPPPRFRFPTTRYRGVRCVCWDVPVLSRVCMHFLNPACVLACVRAWVHAGPLTDKAPVSKVVFFSTLLGSLFLHSVRKDGGFPGLSLGPKGPGRPFPTMFLPFICEGGSRTPTRLVCVHHGVVVVEGLHRAVFFPCLVSCVCPVARRCDLGGGGGGGGVGVAVSFGVGV
jgi:hypothetical protein